MTNIVTNLSPETINDIAKVMTDFGFHITVTGIGQLIVAIFVVARLLRKAVPDNWQNGAIGTALRHAALEVNPQKPTVIITTSTGIQGNRPQG